MTRPLLTAVDTAPTASGTVPHLVTLLLRAFSLGFAGRDHPLDLAHELGKLERLQRQRAIRLAQQALLDEFNRR